MTTLNFRVPTGPVTTVRHTVQRLSNVVSGQVTSCVLSGPPLTAAITAVVPDDRVTKVREVCKAIGVTCDAN